MADYLYPNGMLYILNDSVNFLSDTIYAMLTEGYTPAATHAFRSDVTGEVTGTGYTAAGQVIAGKSVTLVQANSWTRVWAVGTAYAVGQIVKPSVGNQNGHVYVCVVAGTSHATTEPTWTTVKQRDVTDNTVTWSEFGIAVNTMTCSAITWATSTITANGLVLYKHRGGASTADEVILFKDAHQAGGGDTISTNGNWTFTPDATQGLLNFAA